MPTLRIHPEDNVLVALDVLEKGAQLPHGVVTQSRIPAKHKTAACMLAPGDPVVMYGVQVGQATGHIPAGGLLTTRNVTHDVAPFVVRRGEYQWNPPDVTPWRDRYFLGYHRSDGQVGAANHWLVLPLVFCENRNVHVLKRAFEQELGYGVSTPYRRQVAELVDLYQAGASLEALRSVEPGVTIDRAARRVFANVDGIQFLTHTLGCGGTRQDARALCGLFAGYLHHPNVAGGTVLSLGCENAQIGMLKEEIRRRNPRFDKPLLSFVQQRHASADAMLRAATQDTFAALVEANALERRPAPLSKLTLGLECGGSDGFSGLSANPAIGHAADIMVALGGRAILAEFPELCGVEQSLVDRCERLADAQRFANLMQHYAAAAASVGAGFDMNPSAGNIRDGLLTDAMKSAGAAKKGGTAPISAVLDYPEYASRSGLHLLCTPGGDVESTTALAGAGAQVILFSTGMGTPTGNAVTPVVKISSSTALYQRLPDLIDLDAGGIIDGVDTIEEVGSRIMEFVISVASGACVSKASQLGQQDFIPWKRGISL